MIRQFEKKNTHYIIRFQGGTFRNDVTLMHTLEEAHFNTQQKYWVATASDWNKGILIKNGFKDISAKEVEASPFIPPIIRKEVQIDRTKLSPDLFQYQIDGVMEAEKHDGNLMILDSPGVGKTAQAISYCKLHPEYKVLVVCPGFIKINWQREIKRWSGESSTVLSGMIPYEFDKNNRFVIINYDLLSAWKIELIKYKFDVVIGDEVQYVSNYKAHRTKAFIAIADKIPKKLLLSGTPFKNKPAEFFTALNLVSPNNFPNRWKFLWRYCNPQHSGYGWVFNGATHIDELVERTKPFYIRRTKEEVLPYLPQKQINVVGFDMAHSHQLQYESASETFQEWAVSANKKYTDGKAHVETLRTIAYLGKREYALQWIHDFLETGKKLVIFVYHREAIKDVVGALGNLCVSIDGSNTAEERQQSVDEFQNNPKIKALVGQIQAAGVGITLTAASDAVFLEFPWTPADALQASDRCIAKDTPIFYLPSESSGAIKVSNIQDLKIGDSVLTHGGDYKKITRIKHKEHRGLTTSIKYVGWWEPLICTHDHKILVKRADTVKWVEAHQLLPTDSMAFPKNKCEKPLVSVGIKKEWRVYENLNKPVHCTFENCGNPIVARNLCSHHYRKMLKEGHVFSKCKYQSPRHVKLPDRIMIDDDWLYLFGWYVAEGFASVRDGKGKFISFSGHENERSILEKIAKTLEKIGVKSTIYTNKHDHGIEMRSYSTELACWFIDWFSNKSQKIRLPNELLNLPPEQAKIFLQAYTDGDGYYRGNSVEWVSASEVLCYQMCLLAIKCGYIPTMRKVTNKRNDVCYIGAYSKNNNPKTSNKRMNDQDDYYIYRPIRSVTTESKKVEVYDLSVEEDHSFTVGFSTVHNCHRIGQKADKVTIWYMVTEKTIDEDMMAMIQEKHKILDKILDKGTADPFFGEDILTLMRRKYENN